MPVINPLYNPHWEAIHDYHHEQRERLQQEMRAFANKERQDPWAVSYAELERDFQFHHKTCLHVLDRLQHKTVSDFAKWLFEHFSFKMDTSTVPPYDDFQSIDEALALWRKLSDEQRRAEEREWKKLDEAKHQSHKMDVEPDTRPSLVRGEPLIPVNQNFLSRLMQPLLSLLPH